MKQLMAYMGLGLAVIAWTQTMSSISPYTSAWLVPPLRSLGLLF
jgi:hypothetical protein